MKLLVGTYTRGTGSEGIYEVDLTTGRVGLVAAADNPSFLIADRQRERLYAVNENGDYAPANQSGAVNSYRASNGQLQLTGQVASGGADPCHLAIRPGGGCLAVANYTGGSLALLPLTAAGDVDAELAAQVQQHQCSGPNSARQASAHVHHVLWHDADLYCTDLGGDRVFAYRVAQDGMLSASTSGLRSLPAGAGPRQCWIDERSGEAYVITELSNEIVAYHRGEPNPHRSWSTLPADYEGESACAELQASSDGRFLYASNRGADTIAVFEVSAAGLRLCQHIDCGGQHPRHFVVTDDQVIVANRDSDNLVVLQRDQSSGQLTSTGRAISVPAPVCLLAGFQLD